MNSSIADANRNPAAPASRQSNRKLRVLAIGHSYCVALNRAIVRELASDQEFDITVAAPSYYHGDLRPIVMEPEPDGSALRLVGLDTRRSRFVHVFGYDGAALKKLIREGNFEVVLVWEEPYIFAGYQIARALSRSAARLCFLTCQNYVKRYPPPFDYFERSVLARSQGWIAIGRLVREAMLARGYPNDQGQVLNLAVDLNAFGPLSNETRSAVVRELALQPPVIGFVGRLTRDKGLDILMAAMDLIGPSRPWSMLLLGSGEYEAKITEWAAARGWRDRVKILLARHDEVPRYVGCMDLLAAPSQTMPNWKEQFGRMLVEAFASGVPVIGSDSGEIPYVIGDAGIVVGEADVKGWAAAITKLLDNPAERHQMAQRGLARSNRFSAATIAQQYRDFFRLLAEQKVS